VPRMVKLQWIRRLFAAAVAIAFCILSNTIAAVADHAGKIEAQTTPSSTPRFAVRELYAPGHFGNSYEVMGQYEMRRYLAESKRWGFNRYGDWFDMADCSDPFAKPRIVMLGGALWEQKKRNFLTAQALGYDCELILTPNHVFIDQCRPDLLAKKNRRIIGQVICPSNPEARALILKNCENLFADLAAAGVRLKSITSYPYDFGGCDCEKCRPWIITYAKLMRAIHSRAEHFHPKLENHVCGWQWTRQEHEQLAEWADREAPGWIKSIYLHIPYGKTGVTDVPLPKGCERRAFVHIGYSDYFRTGERDRDLYGHFGPVVAPVRMTQTVDDLAKAGVTGVAAYSEGVFDDANKALLVGLASGHYRTADEVLQDYARRHFGAKDPQAAKWAKWLAAWGSPFDVDPREMAEQLQQLTNQSNAREWRRRQWELKVDLMRLHKAIGAGKEWTPERLKAVDDFWRVQEQIRRGLWGLGPQRSIFERRCTYAAWYPGWAKYSATHIGDVDEEQ
jgi:hypothetical protein